MYATGTEIYQETLAMALAKTLQVAIISAWCSDSVVQVPFAVFDPELVPLMCDDFDETNNSDASDEETAHPRKEGNSTVLSSSTHVADKKRGGGPKPTQQERPLNDVPAFVCAASSVFCFLIPAGDCGTE